MNKLYYLFIFSVCLTLAACGPDDDTNSPSSPVPDDESKNFLGYWHMVNGDYDFLFNEDGSCIAYDTYSNTSKSGQWNYDKSTRMLSTNVGTWLIASNSSSNWLGTNTGTYSVANYVRSDLHHLWQAYLTKYRWDKKEGDDLWNDSFNFTFDQVNYTTDTSIYLSGSEYSDMSFVTSTMSLSVSMSEFIVDDVSLYPKSATMSIGNVKLLDGQFTAYLTQVVKYDCCVTFHGYDDDGYKGNSQTKWSEETDDVSLNITLTQINTNNPSLTFEYKGTKFASYKGIKK